MKKIIALAMLLGCAASNATTITIEPDDYAVGTDLTSVSPYVTITRGTGPVFAEACCYLPGGLAPTGSNYFGTYGFYYVPNDPYAVSQHGRSFVAQFADDVTSVSVDTNWGSPDEFQFVQFSMFWATYTAEGSQVGFGQLLLPPVNQVYTFALNLDPSVRYLALGGDDSIQALRVDHLTVEVPEPTTFAMFGLALAGIALRRRKHRC